MATAPTVTTDPLLETQLFWSRYQKAIIIGLVAVMLIVGAVAVYRFYTGRKEASAAAALARAKGMEEYQRVIAEYPASGAAASAYLLLATQQRDKQQFAEANSTLQLFMKEFPKHQLVTTAKMAMAGNLEAMGKPDEALEMYRRLAADNPTSYNAPLAMMAQVPLLKQRGQIDEARRVCETVLTQYRESFAAQEATQLLRTLKPASAPAAAVPGPAAAPVAPPAVESTAPPAATP